VKRIWFVAFVWGTLLTFCLSARAHAGELRAGAAKVSITPSADEFPYQWGHERSFVGVHDDVFARALVLDDGNTRVVFVVEEVTSVPNAHDVVAEVAAAVGVPISNVIVSASHTHESLTVFIHGDQLSPTQQKEIGRATQGAVQAAKEAVAHLQPAKIAFGVGYADVNINNGEAAGLTTGFDPHGPSNKTLDVMRVETMNGKPIALMLNYASHAETMFRSVTKDGGYEVSGDIPGAVSRIMEANPAGAPVVLFTAGAEGDQLPIFKSLQPAANNVPAFDAGASGWAILEVIARRLAYAVVETESRMEPAESNVTIQAATKGIFCPGRSTHMDIQTHETVETDGPSVDIPLSTIRINDILIAAVGGDVASRIGEEIRSASLARETVVLTQMAGSVGYILPDASYIRPSHGLAGTRLKAGCAEIALPQAVAAMSGSHANKN
jgi:neutral ceramidase